MKQGFTLAELLAVIVILAIISAIATPIVTGIIHDSKKSANLRSAESYIREVETTLMEQNMDNDMDLVFLSCIVIEGNLSCNNDTLNFEIDIIGDFPDNQSTILYNEGAIKEVKLMYDDIIIINDEEGNLIYESKIN